MSIEASIQTSLYRLLELSGVEAKASEATPITASPLEPLLNAPPSVVVDALAFHIDDIARTCNEIMSGVVSLQSVPIEAEVFDNIVSSIWGAADDQRFHVFHSPIYLENIRELLLRSHNVDEGRYVRPSQAEAVHYTLVNIDKLAGVITSYTTLLEDEVRTVSDDIVTYVTACSATRTSIEKFSLAIDADLEKLATSFADLTRVILQLALVILRSDTALSLVMYNQLSIDPEDR